jgi:hypothetical protein
MPQAPGGVPGACGGAVNAQERRTCPKCHVGRSQTNTAIRALRAVSAGLPPLRWGLIASQ